MGNILWGVNCPKLVKNKNITEINTIGKIIKVVFKVALKSNLFAMQMAMIKKDNTFVMFQTMSSIKEDIGNLFETIGASLTFYLTIDDVENLYLDIKNKVKIIKEIETKFYGMKEFYIQDCNGYILGFGSKAWI